MKKQKMRLATLLLSLTMCMGLAAPAMADVWDTNEDAWGDKVNLFNAEWEEYIDIDGLLYTGHVNAEGDQGYTPTFAWTVCYCSEPARVTIAQSAADIWDLGSGLDRMNVAADGKLTKVGNLDPTWQNAVEYEDEYNGKIALNGKGTYWDLTEGVYYMWSGADNNNLYLVVGNPDNIPEVAVSGDSAPAPAFKDVKTGEYYYEPVSWAVNKGVTTGTTATTFSPEETCTQAQILTFLWRAAGEPEAAISNPYGNAAVTAGQYFYKPLLWAWEQGIISDKALDPNADCQRSDVVSYLWKLDGKPKAGVANFTDVAAGDDYAEPVAWAVNKGVTTGTTATTFGPGETCTRGQIVTFLWRYFVGE